MIKRDTEHGKHYFYVFHSFNTLFSWENSFELWFKLRVTCPGLNIRKSALVRALLCIQYTATSNVLNSYRLQGYFRAELDMLICLMVEVNTMKYLPLAWVCSVVYYSKSVGPWTRVKMDDKTEGEKPMFIQLTSKALLYYLLSKTSVAKCQLMNTLTLCMATLTRQRLLRWKIVTRMIKYIQLMISSLILI